MPSNADRDLVLALNAANRLTRGALCRLATTTERWRNADRRDAGRLAAELGVPKLQLQRALDLVPTASELSDAERARAAAADSRLLTRFDDEYPRRLLDHPLPPAVLACRGRLEDGPAVAIVGSRRMDAYGYEAACLFAGGLARAGITVVSGFAVGVDQAAHRAALDAGGRTLAVLGCGIDIDYPSGSRRLASAIAERGALLSELPFGTEPRAWHFPIRNRIIAALGAATLVVQAMPRSGSLITAHQALDLGRDVFAVPGRIVDALSAGTNELLADGAFPALAVDDLLDQLCAEWQLDLFPPPDRPTEPTPTSATSAAPRGPQPKGFAAQVVQHLPPGRVRTAEELAIELESPVDRVLGALLELELGGAIERRPGPVYCR
ncbi:MAG: DNA-processing protein DprA [Acidobacteriota bacterium]